MRIVGDLPFKNGILHEHTMYYQKLICKQNVHCELMLVKNALYSHEDVLKIEFLKQCGYKIS